MHDAARSQTPFTRVEVSDGVVAVEYAGKVLTLRAGDTWQSLQSAPAPRREPKLRPQLRSDAEVTSSLAEQNRLFKAATQARSRGEHAEAAALFGQLLGRFPKSPLAPDARVHRARELEHVRRTPSSGSVTSGEDEGP